MQQQDSEDVDNWSVASSSAPASPHNTLSALHDQVDKQLDNGPDDANEQKTQTTNHEHRSNVAIKTKTKRVQLSSGLALVLERQLTDRHNTQNTDQTGTERDDDDSWTHNLQLLLHTRNAFLCFLVSDATYLVLQLLQEISNASSASSGTEWMSTVLCVYMVVVCVPCVIVTALSLTTAQSDTHTDTSPIWALVTCVYSAKNILSALVSLVVVFIVLVLSAPAHSLLVYLFSVPYFLIGAYIARNAHI